ncbi:MAG: BamA/TamA family outer membrane protein [Bacteroidales bacterium]|nr:BamA/TamA family outer membrane protein [Bacteroidales bacterium]
MKRLCIILLMVGILFPALSHGQTQDTLRTVQAIDTLRMKPRGEKKPETEVLVAPPDTTVKSSEANELAKGDIVKTGLSFGPLPVVAFDNDKGFQYGALLNIYNFGDGSWYPIPKSQWYFELSRFTKGSQLYVISYDNRTLIPGVRLSTALQVTKDKALDFYGFNGYESFYDSSLETGFYRMNRMVHTFKVDFTGQLEDNFYWKAGYHFSHFRTGSFEGENYTLPTTLFDIYKAAEIIPEDQADGGISSAIRVGIMYDSRDFEAAPSKGIWAEANIAYAPKFLGTSVGYTKYNLTFRNYLPIAKDKLVFAYRLNLQGFLGKESPAFYMLPYDMYLGTGYDREGFGGYRAVRGLMRGRVQGAHTGYFNTELRWRFVSFHLWKQNIAFALSGFFDGARVFKGFSNDFKVSGLSSYNLTSSYYPPQGGPQQYMLYGGKEKFHLSAGGGIRFIMNRNFIVAFEYGKAFDAQDNSKGAFYINTGFLF